MLFILWLIGLIIFVSFLATLDWSGAFNRSLTMLGWSFGILFILYLIASLLKLAAKKLETKYPNAKLKLTDDGNKYLSHISEADLLNAKKEIAICDKLIDKIIKQHKNELLRKRRQYIKDKGYGVIDKSKWESEKIHFINSVLRVQAKNAIADRSDISLGWYIEGRLDELVRKLSIAPPMGEPIEFEHYCASELERTGWRVSTTKASGDQGADVIAKKDQLKVVLQCKQYSKPVGNAAVQEAHSAKSHYNADFAVVVTNKSYTKSAKQLAASTGVLLLHQDELADLDSLLEAS